MAGVGRGADAVARPHRGIGAGHGPMGADELGHDRFVGGRLGPGRHVRLPGGLGHYQLIGEVSVSRRYLIQQRGQVGDDAVLGHTRNDPKVEGERGRVLMVGDVAHGHSREPGDQRVGVEVDPAALARRLEGHIGRAEGLEDLRRLLDGVYVGDPGLELADDADLALDVADRDHPHVEIAGLGDDAEVGPAAALDQVQRSDPAARLGHHAGHDEISFERPPRPADRLRGGEVGGDAGLHVDGAQAVEVAVVDLSPERVAGPLVLSERAAVPVAGVGVPAQHQRRSGPVSGQGGDGLVGDVALVRHLLEIDAVAAFEEPALQPAGDLGFAPQRRRHPYQLPGQLHRLRRVQMAEDLGRYGSAVRARRRGGPGAACLAGPIHGRPPRSTARRR